MIHFRASFVIWTTSLLKIQALKAYYKSYTLLSLVKAVIAKKVRLITHSRSLLSLLRTYGPYNRGVVRITASIPLGPFRIIL